MVYQAKFPVVGNEDVGKVLGDFKTPKRAKLYISLFEGLVEHQFQALTATSLTFGLHLVSGGAAADNFSQGNNVEGALSLAGDAAFFLCGPLAKLATAKGAARAATAMRVAGTGIEFGLGGVRAGQGFLALYNGKSQEAAGYLGEATLRLLGASASTISLLKSRNAGLIKQAGTDLQVQQYWEDYYNAAGRQGDDLSKIVKRLEKKGIKIKPGEQATYNRSTKTITYAPDTKRWAIFEEYLHAMVHQENWFADDIAKLTAELSKGKKIAGKWIKPKAPEYSAEEIIVKTYLVEHLPLNTADSTVLRAQIDQLRMFGTKYGY